MNLRFFFINCFLLTVFCAGAQTRQQKAGSWHTHLARYTTTSVAESDQYVYAVADGTLYRYGKADNSVHTYSIQTGLNDTDVELIRYNPSVKKLLVIYTNGNMDIMDEDNNITNVPFIKNAGHIQDKTVHSVYFSGEKAYLAAGFGIWVYQMEKREAAGTYPVQATSGVSIRNEYIYASTVEGIKKALVSDNLLDPNNWHTVHLTSGDIRFGSFGELYLFQQMICFRDSNGVFALNAADEIQVVRRDKSLTGMKQEADYLIPFTAATAYFYGSLNQFDSNGFGIINDISALKSDGNCWVASGSKGLIGAKRTAANKFEIFLSGLNTEGPKRNLNAYMTVHKGKLLVTGGGRWTDRSRLPGTLMVYEGGKWFNFDEDKVNKQAGVCRDYTGVAVDPGDANHYFVSTYGEGVLEFKDNEFVQQFNHKNSSLQSAVPNSSSAANYVRVGSVAFDRAGNLWMTNCSVDNGIVMRSPDGTWKSFDYPGVRNANLVDKILITSKGHKWVNVPRLPENAGILIFDDEGNAYFENAFTSSSDYIRSKVCLSMAEDLDGQIWIGTQQGPIYCSSPANALSNPAKLRFSHVKRTDENDDPYLFLINEQINAIVVDGGNRKWLGTSGSGVYVISPDGSETIHHFTAENSDLYSNTINSIAINHETGEVFIGTDKGLISYQSEATTGSPGYSDVYAYPNPVRPDYDGQVVITGLMMDSNVKITDLSGNIIYQGKSSGGQMVWNCRNR
ncbi:MAG: hypothetical protein LBH90_02005, partial [Tannerella sp.]|nr:hypothetical protein [Tannerella sp.]